MSSQIPSNYHQVFQALEVSAKYATVTVGLLYGVGLLVANYYLLDLGFAEFELFRSRYVFIGLLFVLPILICAAIAYLVCSISHAPLVARHRAALSMAIGALVALIAISARYANRSQLLLSLVLAALVGIAFILFEAPEILPRMSGLRNRALALDKPNHASPVLVLILTIPLALYFFVWAKFAFSGIPEQFGGAEPKYGYFYVREEHVADAQLVGLQVDEDHRDSQGLRMFWEGSDYVIFESEHDGIVGLTKVSDELFFAWVPYEFTELVPMTPSKPLPS